MAFLKQFGISLIRPVVVDPVIQLDPPDTKYTKKIKRISPYGYEIDDDGFAQPGTRVYVMINGDLQDPDNDYETVFVDSDGDAVVSIAVDVHRLQDIFISVDGGLKELPSKRAVVDEDGDLTIDLHDFVHKSTIKISLFLEKLEVPVDAGFSWYNGKYKYTAKDGWRYHNGKDWHWIAMAIDDTLVDGGVYKFKCG